jgi:hypothetical protein
MAVNGSTGPGVARHAFRPLAAAAELAVPLTADDILFMIAADEHMMADLSAVRGCTLRTPAGPVWCPRMSRR